MLESRDMVKIYHEKVKQSWVHQTNYLKQFCKEQNSDPSEGNY